MIPVSVNGRKFGIRFSHTPIARYPEGHALAGQPKCRKDLVVKKTVDDRRTTECILVEVFEDGGVTSFVTIAKAEAKCSVLDNFSKNAGRGLSLAKALKAARKSGDPLFTATSREEAEDVALVEDAFFAYYALRGRSSEDIESAIGHLLVARMASSDGPDGYSAPEAAA